MPEAPGTLRPAVGRRRRGLAHARRRIDARHRRLPDVLVIGAQKGGTTSLHHWLAAHPGMAEPVTKEIHRYTLHATRPTAWYRAHFPVDDGRMTGEATPYYLFHPAVPARVARELPDVRVIAVLRDPVSRAISHHHHERTLGFEDLDLRAALDAEPRRLAGAEELLLRDPRATSHAHQHHSYVARGRYADQLERWRAHVPAERTLVLFSEDLFARPEETLARAQAFLGLPRHVPRDLRALNARSYGDAEPALVERLRATFAGEASRVARLAGVLPPWP